MTFKASVKTCFRKFATFQGRASRSEYWWFFLFMLIVIYLPLFAAGFAEGAGETTIAIP